MALILCEPFPTRSTTTNSLEILALLVDVAFVRALPWQVHCGPPALVERKKQVGARVPERHRHFRRNHLLLRCLALHAVVTAHFSAETAVFETKSNEYDPISGPVKNGKTTAVGRIGAKHSAKAKGCTSRCQGGAMPCHVCLHRRIGDTRTEKACTREVRALHPQAASLHRE